MGNKIKSKWELVDIKEASPRYYLHFRRTDAWTDELTIELGKQYEYDYDLVFHTYLSNKPEYYAFMLQPLQKDRMETTYFQNGQDKITVVKTKR